MWHLDNIYHEKKGADLPQCQRTLGFVFLCVAGRHIPNVFNVLRAAEVQSFIVLEHNRHYTVRNSDSPSKIKAFPAAAFCF